MKKRVFLFLGGVVFFMSARVLGMGSDREPESFPIEITIDYGVAGKPAVQERIYIQEGTSAKEALSQVVPIMSGVTCCSVRDVVQIDGVRIDPAQKRWWICLLNGSKDMSPVKTKLRPDDRIEWKYIQSEGM